MGNRSSDARVKYYGVQGAPTVFLNGKRLSRGESNSGEDRDLNTAISTYAALNTEIRSSLKTPVEWQTSVQGVRYGSNVKAAYTVRPAKDLPTDLPADVTLHIALVENEVTLSGENGLRFHPMVVRGLARMPGAPDYGLTQGSLQSGKGEYTFRSRKHNRREPKVITTNGLSNVRRRSMLELAEKRTLTSASSESTGI